MLDGHLNKGCSLKVKTPPIYYADPIIQHIMLIEECSALHDIIVFRLTILPLVNDITAEE